MVGEPSDVQGRARQARGKPQETNDSERGVQLKMFSSSPRVDVRGTHLRLLCSVDGGSRSQ